MTVNGTSPFSAAARLLAFGAFVPTGSSIAVALMGRLSTPPVLVMAIGGGLEVIGTAILSQTSSGFEVKSYQYTFFWAI
jgi:phospholipid N-methyltransferase